MRRLHRVALADRSIVRSICRSITLPKAERLADRVFVSFALAIIFQARKEKAS